MAIIRFLAILLLTLSAVPAQPPGYVSAHECRPCHAKVYAGYQLTGMARSFYSAAAGEEVVDFYNPASDTHYSMFRRDGRYFQRRWQIGFDGKETNSEAMPVDFVMGSGNHARTYLSGTSRGTLIQLPLGWYAEKGGYWGMNPGYDTAHPPSHRAIAYECMFCHNAYPRIPTGHAAPGSEPVYTSDIPEGIDCQRCHGPGAAHTAAAKTGKPIKGTIVNPAKLTKERQMEVCMQCHLETTSTRLPGLVRRFDRGPFSYVAGQPLSAFVLAFDHAPGTGHDDKFEIAGGAYRLRQSQCFLKSKGELTCETCHDPHNIPRGAAATAYYSGVCRQCHATVTLANHPAGGDCVACHMPRRRTDDAVHVAMTDHLIQRRAPARDLLADKPESHPAAQDEYKGEVVPYYPSQGVSDLYRALAQVQEGTNLTAGIAELTSALARDVSPPADFYLALGDAWHKVGDDSKAAGAYGQAVKLRPGSERAMRYLGIALKDQRVLRHALQLEPSDAQAWFGLGLIAGGPDAVQALRKANSLNPDLPDVWNSLGVNLNDENAFRQALRIDPYYATANGNLARLLAAKGDTTQATYYFEKVARLQPSDAVNLYEYALMLAQRNRFDDSQREVELAAQADPNLAEAHELLGGLLARRKDMDAALREYREAVRIKPEFSRAQLDLGATLASRGDTSEAIAHFREAAKSPDPHIADPAVRALRQLGGAP